MFSNLTDENFEMYAMKSYENVLCTSMEEFYDDLKRIHYIKRLFKKYRESGVIKERLIINHLLVLYNTFDSVAMTRMLFLKLDDHLSALKPFLILLGRWPAKIDLIDGKEIRDDEIPIDQYLVKILRAI